MEEAKRAADPAQSYEGNSYWSNVSWTPMWQGADILSLYSVDTIHAMMHDPMLHNKELREISRALYSCNGVVTNVIDYYTALPTLSKVVVPHGNQPTKKKKYKQAAEDALRVIRDKEVMRDGIFNTLMEGVYFAYLETRERPLSKQKSMSMWDVQNIVELEQNEYIASVIYLNPDYTRIVGIQGGSPVLAIDLQYFDIGDNEPAADKLRKFPAEIRKAYDRWKAGKEKQWAVLDNSHTIAVKFRAKRSEPYGRPLVLAAIDDILYDAYKTRVKRGALEAVNNRIIYQTFPEGKNKGESALTEKQQQSQHEAVRGAITSPGASATQTNTTFFSVAAGTKIDVLKPDVTILDSDHDNSLQKSIATALGAAFSLLSGEGTSSFSAQENNLQLITAEVFHVVEMLQAELNKVLNACIIKNPKYWVEVQYLPITYCNRRQWVEMSKDLYLQGKGSLSLWASAVGINPDAFYALLDEELEDDVEHKYPVHQTSYTYTGNDERGRPMEEDSTNPKTLNTRSIAGNDTPKPGDM